MERHMAITEVVGESLKDRLKREERLRFHEAARIARDAATQLEELHGRGIVHRNVGLECLVFDSAGQLSLREARSSPDEGASLLDRLGDSGSSAFLSPEQAAGEIVWLASDLFALGCVLYQMVTGEPPFHAANAAELSRAIVFESAKPARDLNPEIPAGLSEFIDQLLAKMPGERPKSAFEVATRLAEWSDSSPRFTEPPPVSAPVISASRRILESMGATRTLPEPGQVEVKAVVVVSPEPPKKKLRWLPDIIAGLLLLAAAGGLYSWWKASRTPAPAPPPAAKENK
jgi:serine/threonine protein kinase